MTSEQQLRILDSLYVPRSFSGVELRRHMKLATLNSDYLELEIVRNLWFWEDGWEALDVISRHENCDLGTALSIFWAGEPEIYLSDWMLSADHHSFDVEHRDMLTAIQKRVIAGAFITSTVTFQHSLSSTDILNNVDARMYISINGCNFEREKAIVSRMINAKYQQGQ